MCPSACPCASEGALIGRRAARRNVAHAVVRPTSYTKVLALPGRLNDDRLCSAAGHPSRSTPAVAVQNDAPERHCSSESARTYRHICARRLLHTDRRFCARFAGPLTRHSVRLDRGPHGSNRSDLSSQPCGSQPDWVQYVMPTAQEQRTHGWWGMCRGSPCPSSAPL